MELQGLKIDCISDTHMRHDNLDLPGGDILIHAGDATGRGSDEEITQFLDWFQKQDYRHLVLIAGNHDWGYETKPQLWAKECESRNIHLLNDSGVELEGIKFWGSPVQPEFCNWAFNRNRGEDIKKHWDLIPNDTDVLVTHGPPHKMRDEAPRRHRSGRGGHENVGCVDLWNKILETKIKMHVFGHIHEGAGHTYFMDRLFVNAASLDGRYCQRYPGFTRIVKEGESYVVDLPTQS